MAIADQPVAPDTDYIERAAGEKFDRLAPQSSH